MMSSFEDYMLLLKEDMTPVDQLELDWMWFHISSTDLGDEFVFTPRTPKNPFLDINQDTIEDTRTPRVSWAPSIRKAIEALGGNIFTGYIYGAHDLPGEINIQDEFEECPGSPDNEYGVGFTWKKYEDYVEKVAKKELDATDKADALEKCVPDARDTEEQWATGPVKGKKIGVIKRGKVYAL